MKKRYRKYSVVAPHKADTTIIDKLKEELREAKHELDLVQDILDSARVDFSARLSVQKQAGDSAVRIIAILLKKMNLQKIDISENEIMNTEGNLILSPDLELKTWTLILNEETKNNVS